MSTDATAGLESVEEISESEAARLALIQQHMDQQASADERLRKELADANARSNAMVEEITGKMIRGETPRQKLLKQIFSGGRQEFPEAVQADAEALNSILMSYPKLVSLTLAFVRGKVKKITEAVEAVLNEENP